jgi:hypothetical protein
MISALWPQKNGTGMQQASPSGHHHEMECGQPSRKARRYDNYIYR